jgi:Fe2+ transport system protein B
MYPTQDGQPPKIENSLAGSLGRTIEPVIKPLGFNWKIGIGLITSLAARETIVATLGAIYGMDPETEAVRPRSRAGARSDSRRRIRAAGLFCIRDAMHLDYRGSPPRDRGMEMAHPAVRLHERDGVRRGVHRGAADRLSSVLYCITISSVSDHSTAVSAA